MFKFVNKRYIQRIFLTKRSTFYQLSNNTSFYENIAKHFHKA